MAVRRNARWVRLGATLVGAMACAAAVQAQSSAQAQPQWQVQGQAQGAGQAPASASPLGLVQAWTAAFEHDSAMRAARAASGAQRERLPQAQARLRPSVTFSANANRNDIQRTQSAADGSSSRVDENYSSQNYNLTLRQPLYRPALLIDRAQADQVILESEASLEAESRNLAVRLTTAYLEALLAQDQQAFVQIQEKTLRVQLDAARAGLQAGSGVRTDIDEVQARLDLNQAQALEAAQQIDSSRRQLAVMVQRPFTALQGLGDEKLRLPPLASLEVEHWVQQAMQHSPELRGLEARRDAVRLEVDKASASRKPTVDLVGQVVRSSSENVLTPASRYQNQILGLQLNLPIYTGGLIDSAVRQASAELQRAEETLEGARRDLSVRVHREFRASTEGERRISALEQALRSATQLVESNRRSMQAGSRTLIDVLNAEQQLAQVRRDLSQTRYVTALSRLRLEMLVGESPLESVGRIGAALGGR